MFAGMMCRRVSVSEDVAEDVAEDAVAEEAVAEDAVAEDVAVEDAVAEDVVSEVADNFVPEAVSETAVSHAESDAESDAERDAESDAESDAKTAWKGSWWSELPGVWATFAEGVHDVVTTARATWAYVRAHVWARAGSAISAFLGANEPLASPRPEVFRVHAFVGDPYHGDHRDLTHRLDLWRLDDWEARVAELPGWATTSSKFRVEMRYTYGSSRKVYRMVLRHGDAFGLPDAQKRCRLPRNILSAHLMGGVVTPGVTCDVLHRVSKYAGPLGDFHAFLGLHVRVQELFPFDDQDQNCARFECVRTIDTNACVRDYAYAKNQVMVPVSTPPSMYRRPPLAAVEEESRGITADE